MALTMAIRGDAPNAFKSDIFWQEISSLCCQLLFLISIAAATRGSHHPRGFLPREALIQGAVGLGLRSCLRGVNCPAMKLSEIPNFRLLEGSGSFLFSGKIMYIAKASFYNVCFYFLLSDHLTDIFGLKSLHRLGRILTCDSRRLSRPECFSISETAAGAVNPILCMRDSTDGRVDWNSAQIVDIVPFRDGPR